MTAPHHPAFGKLVNLAATVALGLASVCALLMFFAGKPPSPALAAPLYTEISSDITDAVWIPSQSPYTVTAAINVTGTLTISPGVEVRFTTAGASLNFNNGGQLIAVGTASNAITFTSDSPGSTYWNGLRLNSDAMSATVQYAIVEYAQVGLDLNDVDASVIASNTIRYINGDGAIIGSPDVSNIEGNSIYSVTTGIKVNESDLNIIDNNQIYNTGGDCISIGKNTATNGGNKNTVSNNKIHNCGELGILFEGGPSGNNRNIVSGNQIWNTGAAAFYAHNQQRVWFQSNQVYSTALTSTSMATGAVILDSVANYFGSQTLVQDNYLHGNGGSASYQGALIIQNASDPLEISGSRVVDNNAGGLVFAGTNNFGGGETIQNNAICVNGQYAIENRDGNVVAEGNWLGTNLPVAGAEITGTVDITPFIQLSGGASPTFLPADGVTPAVITVTMNDGAAHTVPNLPAGGRNLNLSADLGTLADSLLTLDGSGLTPGTSLTSGTPGTAVLTVTEWCGFAITVTVQFTGTDVAITKSSAVTQVIPGKNITYTLSYTNSGAITATNVIITDTLPVDAVYDSASVSPVQTTTGVVWNVGDVPSGTTSVITLVATLPATATTNCGQTITNSALIDTATTETNPGNNGPAQVGVGVICADVTLDKTGPGGIIRPGEMVTYTITYTNEGQAPAQNVVITDINPVSGSVDSVLPSPGTVLPGAGGSRDYTVTADVSICTGSFLTNTAFIGTATPESGTGNNSATSSLGTSPQIQCLPDLQVSKSNGLAPGDFVYANEQITYTITFSNVGWADATGVVLTETLPTYTLFAGPTGAGGWFQVGSTNLYTYLVGTLPYTPAGTNVSSITFVVQVTPTLPLTVTTITNTVSIGSDQTDDNPGDDDDDEPTPVRSIPDLGVTKTSLTAQISPGGLATYAVTITNQSDTTATNVIITDTLPASTTYNSDNLGVGAPTLAGGLAVWSTGQSILAGNSITFNLTVQANSGGSTICDPGNPNTHLINTVEAYGDGRRDQDPADNSDTTGSDTTSPLVVCHDLIITKTLSSLASSAGKVSTFTLSYRNIGSYTATNVVLTDVLDSNVIYVTDTLGLTPVTPTNTVVWSLPADLGPGQGGTFDIGLTLDVNAIVCSGGVITYINTARIESALPDADPSNNQDSVDTGNTGLIPCGVDLVVVKNDNVGAGNAITQVVAGGYISYTISVNNIGSETATSVVLTETLPPTTTFAGGTPSGWSGSGGVYTYAVGSLTSGQGRVFEVVVQVDGNLDCATTNLVNRVDAGSGEVDADPSDNFSIDSTPVVCNPLQMSKSDGGIICAVPGQLVDYTITVTNSDSSASAALLLAEFLPANTSFQGPLPVWTDVGSGQYTHTLGSLAAGQVINTAFWVQVDPGLPGSVTAITNQVTLSPGGLSAGLVTPINHTAPDLYVVKNDNIELLGIASNEAINYIEQKAGRVPWLDALKSDGLQAQATSAAPGDVVSYTIAYGNSGGVAATNVVITETIPDNTTLLGPAYWQLVSGNTYVFTMTSVGAGGGGLLHMRVQVDNPFPSGVPGITNTVQIAGDATECDSSDNISMEFTPIRETTTFSGSVYLPIILKNNPPSPTPTPTATPSTPTATPTSTPTPTPLAYVSDVAADPDTNQVFVASPRHDWVYAINGSSDTVARSVPVAHGPTGLTVLDSVVAANNRVFVAHQYAANFWNPGVKILGVNDAASYNPADGGYVGAAPIKIASNGSNNERVYVSNYFDKLVVLNGTSPGGESRVGWVVQKAFQGAYGINVSTSTNRVYLATRDTGELVVFDGNADRLLQPDYIPTHIKPPEACSLWSVAVNETTGHVFVPCPQLGRVFVLEESQVSVLAELESLGVLEERDGYFALVVAAVSAPWIADISIPSGTNLGKEGIAVDTGTSRVFITNDSNNTVVILQDGATPAYAATVSVGTTPQGVDVNPSTQKVYVGNAGSNNVTVLSATSPYTTLTTIPLTP